MNCYWKKKSLPWDISRESVKCFNFMQFSWHSLIFNYWYYCIFQVYHQVLQSSHWITQSHTINCCISPVWRSTKGPIAESRVHSSRFFFSTGRMVGFSGGFVKPIAAGCLVFLKLPSRQCRWWNKNEWGKSYLAELVSQDYKKITQRWRRSIPRNYDCNDLPTQNDSYNFTKYSLTFRLVIAGNVAIPGWSI